MKNKIAFILYIAIISFVNQVYAQFSTPKYSNEFLSLGVGARGLALSGSMTSLVDDVTSGYWNPSGLVGIDTGVQVSLMHSAYFGGLANYDYAAIATQLSDSSSVAFTAIRFAIDDIPDTRFLFDANGALDYSRISFFSAADYAFLLSYSKKLKFLGGINIGSSVKIIHRVAGKFSKAWGFGMDLGIQKQWDKFKIGMTARDITGTFTSWRHNQEEIKEAFVLTENELPQNSTEVTVPRVIFGVSRDISVSNKWKLLPSIDFEITTDGRRNALLTTEWISAQPRTGIELSFENKVFGRLGIGQWQKITEVSGKEKWTAQPAAGMGIILGDVSVDYAFTDVGNISPGLYSHVFSLKIQFYAKSK